jgi:hypothetical protein
MLTDLLIITTLLFASGCATVIHGTTQDVLIETEPPGATVMIFPDEIEIVAPAEIELDRERAYTARASLDGHHVGTGYLDRVFSGAINGNILLGGLIGMSVDIGNGAAFKLTPDPLLIKLTPLDEDPAQPSTSP